MTHSDPLTDAIFSPDVPTTGFDSWIRDDVDERNRALATQQAHVLDTLTPDELIEATSAQIVHDLSKALRLLRSLTFDAQMVLTQPSSPARDATADRVAHGLLKALDMIDGRKH